MPNINCFTGIIPQKMDRNEMRFRKSIDNLKLLLREPFKITNPLKTNIVRHFKSMLILALPDIVPRYLPFFFPVGYLDISLHPDVRDNLHTKRFGFTTGNRQLQLEIDYRLEFDYQQSICLFWKVLGWFEKCPDDLKSVRMIYKMCLDCLKNVQMIC